MKDILYHQVRSLHGLGVKVSALDPRVKLFRPGQSGDTTQGGWVTPGRYALSLDEEGAHDLSGNRTTDRIDDAAGRGEYLLYKVISQEYGDLPFTNDNFTIPAGWDYVSGVEVTSSVEVSSEGEVFGNSLTASDSDNVSSVSTRNTSLDSTVVITLEEGDTLVVGIGSLSGNSRGTDGFTVHCSQRPEWRAMPYGIASGTYDADVWSRFKTNCLAGLSALPYDSTKLIEDNGPTTFHVTTSGDESEEVRAYRSDTRSFEEAVDIIYNTAIKLHQEGGYNRSDERDLWNLFKHVTLNTQYGSGDWCEGINLRHMAHGTDRTSVKRHLTAMKLFFAAAILDSEGVVGNYTPSFEGLHKIATVGQTMKASFPSVVSYGRFNNGASGVETAGTDTAAWLSGVLLDASGPTGQPFEDMFCNGEFRQAGMVIKLWFAKLLGLTIPDEVKQFLYLPQNGSAIVRPWGLTNSRFGHISSPNGVGSSWGDAHNAYTAQAMQWLWLTGEFDHTPMMQWFTKNRHFYDSAFIGAYEGNTSSLPGAYPLVTDSEVIEEPYNLISTTDPTGSSISLVWQNGFEVGKSYEVYQIIDPKFGSDLVSLGGDVNVGTSSHDETYGVVSGTYRLVSTGAVALANIPVSGDGDYYFVVRAIKGHRKSRNSVIKKVTVSSAQQWDGSSTGTTSGVSWEFSGNATVGTYADGSPWVLGPVTVVSTTADNSVLDLSVGQHQPFSSNDDNYNASSDLSYPVTLSGPNSIIGTLSGPGGEVSAMSILTVVTSAPAAGAFRPSPYAGSTDYNLNASDVTTSTFASSVDSSADMFLPRNSTRVETYVNALEGPWYYGDSEPEVVTWTGEAASVRPSGQMLTEGYEAATVFHEAALLLHSSDTDKDLLAVPMAQQCIDMVGSMESAIAAGNRPNPVVARSAGVLLKRLTGATGTFTPTGDATVMDRRTFVLDTSDDRYSTAGGTIITGLSASGTRDFAGRPIGYSRDLTLSTTEVVLADPRAVATDNNDAEGYSLDDIYRRRYQDASWAAAEAMSVALLTGGVADYGNYTPLYFADQEASRPTQMNRYLVGELASDFMQETYDADTSLIAVRADDANLVSNSEIPARDQLTASPSNPDFDEKYRLRGNVITEPGVYEGFYTRSTIHIRANDVIIRDAYIDARNLGHAIECDEGCSGIVIDSCLMAGTNKAAVRASNTVIKDCIISNIAGNGLNVGENSTVSGCYFERIAHVGDGNYFGIIVNGGSNISIVGNYINTPYDVNGSKVINAIRIRPRTADVADVTVSGNWLRGGTGPALRVGAFPSAGNSLSGVVVNYNRFSQESGTTEAWSVASPVSAGVTFEGNQWWNPDNNSVIREPIEEPDYSTPGIGLL